MGILSSIFGNGNERSNARSPMSQPRPAPASQRVAPPPSGAAPSADEQALARYRYLLRTAPPEAIEQVHAEAFARLTPQQRAQALREISAAVPDHERVALMSSQGDPQSLARAATRAELRQPGFLERTLGGSVGGMSTGAMIGTSLLTSFVGSLAGSMLAQQLLGGFHGFGGLGSDQGYGLSGVPGAGYSDASQDIPAPTQADPDQVTTQEDLSADPTEQGDVSADDASSDDVDGGDLGGDIGGDDLDGGDFGGDDFA